MIHEFGVEPALAARWGSLSDFRHFVRAFGYGTPRAISRYPKNWTSLVWEAAGEASLSDMDRKRLEELLARFKEGMVRRIGPFAPGVPWIDNARTEHSRVPFAAILACDGTNTTPLLGIDHLHDSPAWNVPGGITCNRTPAAIAKALAPLLRGCRRIAFVDPHFGPENARFRRPLQALLRAAVHGRPGNPPEEVLVLTSMKCDFEFFASTCHKQLPPIIPLGLKVVLRRLLARPGGEKLHNRYILTDLGGISFGVGLDDGTEGESDDLSVMSAEQYQRRWRQFLGPDASFDQPNVDIVITGTA